MHFQGKNEKGNWLEPSLSEMVNGLRLAKSNQAIMPYTAFTDKSGHWRGHITSEQCLEEEQKLPVE